MEKYVLRGIYTTMILSALLLMAFIIRHDPVKPERIKIAVSKGGTRYLVKDIYIADPSAHVFNNEIFIYPSHDIDTGINDDNSGDHFAMRDYHVFSMKNPDARVIDYGVALDVDDVPWASQQMWAPDAAEKDGKYYLYFPAKDKTDVFRIGVAVSDRPEGPFKAEPDPIRGSFSIDPAVFKDDDGTYYMYFGGLWGGQLQRYRHGKAIECGAVPADSEPALGPQVARMSEDMLQFAEAPRTIQIIDKNGKAILASDHERRFFEASWMHKYKGKYYFSYSTGDTHKLCYATGDRPYGPFTYQGVILTPVIGWTTHHSIIKFNGRWYLFYHDSKLSGGKDWLRSVKVTELKYNPDGSIQTINGKEV